MFRMAAHPIVARREQTFLLAFLLAAALLGCAVVTVAGAVAGAAVSVGGAVVGSTVKVAGKLVEKTIDLAVPGSTPAPVPK